MILILINVIVMSRNFSRRYDIGDPNRALPQETTNFLMTYFRVYPTHNLHIGCGGVHYKVWDPDQMSKFNHFLLVNNSDSVMLRPGFNYVHELKLFGNNFNSKFTVVRISHIFEFITPDTWGIIPVIIPKYVTVGASVIMIEKSPGVYVTNCVLVGKCDRSMILYDPLCWEYLLTRTVSKTQNSIMFSFSILEWILSNNNNKTNDIISLVNHHLVFTSDQMKLMNTEFAGSLGPLGSLKVADTTSSGSSSSPEVISRGNILALTKKMIDMFYYKKLIILEIVSTTPLLVKLQNSSNYTVRFPDEYAPEYLKNINTDNQIDDVSKRRFENILQNIYQDILIAAYMKSLRK